MGFFFLLLFLLHLVRNLCPLLLLYCTFCTVLGLYDQVLVVGGLQGWSVRICQKLAPCPAEPFPAGPAILPHTFSFSSRGDQTSAETALPQVPSANTGLIQKKMCKGVLENFGSFIDQKESEQPFMCVTFVLQILLYFQVFSS